MLHNATKILFLNAIIDLAEADQFKHCYHTILASLVKIGTFPYYRLFHFNTLRPIELIASCTRRSLEPNKLRLLIDRWKRRKRAELQYVSIAVCWNIQTYPSVAAVNDAYVRRAGGSYCCSSRNRLLLLECCIRCLLVGSHLLVLQPRIINSRYPHVSPTNQRIRPY